MAKNVTAPATTRSLQVRPRFLLFQKLIALINHREVTSRATTKKVLFVANSDSFIELFCLPYLSYFQKKGYKVHVVTGTTKPIKHCDLKLPLDMKRSPYHLIHNLRAVRQLYQALLQHRYEIVHCHTPVGGAVARLAVKKYRKNGGNTKVIYTAHGFHFYRGAPLHYWAIFYPIEKYLAKYTDTLITINREDYARACKRFKSRCQQIKHIHGVGVDRKKLQQKLTASQKANLKKSLGLKSKDIIISCVGRLDKNKNQGLLISAMPKLLKINPNYHLLLIGADDLAGKYQKLAQKIGVESNVHFLGFRDDIIRLIQISDFIVSASKREGLPVNLIEAKFLNMPIITTDCRGSRDLIENYPHGLVIKNNEQELVSAIEHFSQNIKSLRHDTKQDIEPTSALAINSVLKKMGEIYNA